MTVVVLSIGAPRGPQEEEGRAKLLQGISQHEFLRTGRSKTSPGSESNSGHSFPSNGSQIMADTRMKAEDRRDCGHRPFSCCVFWGCRGWKLFEEQESARRA